MGQSLPLGVTAHRVIYVILGDMSMKNNFPCCKTFPLILLMILLLPSMACRVIDALQVMVSAATENCRTVSRAAYETACYDLGQKPETPENPEAVAYQVCYADGKPVSAKMVAGYQSEMNDAAEPPENIADEANFSSTPAGTYMGELNEVPPSWNMVKNEFIIEVSEDGSVVGTKTYQIERESADSNCTPRWENGHTTIINGYLSGSTGLAYVQTDSYTIWDMTDCGGVYSHDTYESVCDAAQITISGEKMEISGGGSEGCGFIYKATKQTAP